MLRPGRVPHQLRGREEGDAVPPRGPLRGDAGPVGGGPRREGEERDSPAGGSPRPRGGGAPGRSRSSAGGGSPPWAGGEDKGQGGACPPDLPAHPLPLEGEGADPAESRRRSAPGEDDRRGDGGVPARRGGRPGGRGELTEAL